MIDLRGKWFEVEVYNRLMDKLIDLLIRLGLVEETKNEWSEVE